MAPLKRNVQAAAGALLVMVIALVTSQVFTGADDQNGVTTDSQSQPTVSVVVEEAGTDVSEAPAPIVRFSDLLPINAAELPDEAREVLLLIADGGPYPYRQDDGVFQNREGILPEKAEGHYREYTVETPGSDDRGARRIVAGADGARYYTSDHYDSFEEIVVE